MVNPGFVGFDWDDGNRSKCEKHGMTIADIEHVVVQQTTLLVPSPKGGDEERIMAIGRTPEGRLAMVVFTPRRRGARNLLRPVSARFMHRREARKYEQEVSGPEDR
jgi:uncharacterized DUF497 family protein